MDLERLAGLGGGVLRNPGSLRGGLGSIASLGSGHQRIPSVRVKVPERGCLASAFNSGLIVG